MYVIINVLFPLSFPAFLSLLEPTGQSPRSHWGSKGESANPLGPFGASGGGEKKTLADQRCWAISKRCFQKKWILQRYLFLGRCQCNELHCIHVGVVFDENANFGQMRVFFFGTSDSLKKTITPSLQKPRKHGGFCLCDVVFLDNFKPWDFSRSSALKELPSNLDAEVQNGVFQLGELSQSVVFFWCRFGPSPLTYRVFFVEIFQVVSIFMRIA